MRALLCNEYPIGIAGSGGVEGHVPALAALLRAAGHEAVIVTGQLRDQPEHRTDTHHALPGFGGPVFRRNIIQHRRGQRRALRQLGDLAARFRPDVIHIHNVYNADALRALRALGPTVKSIHDCRPFCTKPRPAVASRLVGNSETFCHLTQGPRCWTRCYARAGQDWHERLEAWTGFPNSLAALREVQACDRILVSSQYLHDLAVTAGTPEDRLDRLHYFTDGEELAAVSAAVDRSVPVVLFAGRLEPEKGPLKLLDALERLPPERVDVRFAGDGPLLTSLRVRAARMGPPRRIRVLGHLDRAALFRECAACSFVAFPSIGSEGCPQIGIEAMHFGKPVVAYDVGGVREWLVDGVTGLLVPRNDTAAFARALAALLGDAALRQRLGQAAHAYVSGKFRRDRYLDGLLAVYRKAIRIHRRQGVHMAGTSMGETE